MFGIVSRVFVLLVLRSALAVRDGGRIPDEENSSLSAQAHQCSRPGANTAPLAASRPGARSVAIISAGLVAPTASAEAAHYRPSHSSLAHSSKAGLLNVSRHVDTEKQIERTGRPRGDGVERYGAVRADARGELHNCAHLQWRQLFFVRTSAPASGRADVDAT